MTLQSLLDALARIADDPRARPNMPVVLRYDVEREAVVDPDDADDDKPTFATITDQAPALSLLIENHELVISAVAEKGALAR